MGELPKDWKKASVTLIFKMGKKEDPGKNRLVNLTSIPEMMEQLVPETIFRHMKDKKTVGSSQSGFTKENSSLTNLINFCHLMTSLMDEGRAMDIVFVDLSMVFFFDAVPVRSL